MNQWEGCLCPTTCLNHANGGICCGGSLALVNYGSEWDKLLLQTREEVR